MGSLGEYGLERGGERRDGEEMVGRTIWSMLSVSSERVLFWEAG